MSFADTLASAVRGATSTVLHLLVHQDPARLKFEASADVAIAIAASGNSLLLKWRAMFCWLPLLFRAGVVFGFGFGFISCLAPSCSGKWLFQSVSTFSCCPVFLYFFPPIFFRLILFCILSHSYGASFVRRQLILLMAQSAEQFILMVVLVLVVDWILETGD